MDRCLFDPRSASKVDVVDDAVREVLLLRVVVEILKGQNGDRFGSLQDRTRERAVKSGPLFRPVSCAFIHVW